MRSSKDGDEGDADEEEEEDAEEEEEDEALSRSCSASVTDACCRMSGSRKARRSPMSTSLRDASDEKAHRSPRFLSNPTAASGHASTCGGSLPSPLPLPPPLLPLSAADDDALPP